MSDVRSGMDTGGTQGVFRVDGAGTIVYLDDRAAQILGYVPEELMGLDFVGLFFESELTRAQQKFEQRRLGVGGVEEYSMRRKDGTAVRVAVASAPTFDAGGDFLGIAGFVTDIDERKRQEEFSAHERRLLRQIASNYPLASVLEDLCLTLEAISPRPLQAAVMLADGNTLKCVAAPSLPSRFREDRAVVRLDEDATLCAAAVRSGSEVVVGDTAQADAAQCRNYGFGAVWSYPVVQDGETLGTLALFLPMPGVPDAEDRRAIEFAVQVARLALAHERKAIALRESEQRFRDYAELSADWYWEQDASFRFTAMSGGAFNKGGFRVADSLGKPRWELPIAGVSETQWAEHRALLERHEAFHDFTYTIRAADDSLRWYSVSGKPVFASDGAFVGYRGIGRDISERKRAEAALLISEQRFRDYAAMSADWFWEQDAGFRFTEVSYGSGIRPMTPHFYGGQSVGRHRWDLAYVNVPEGFWEEHRRLLEAGRPFNSMRLQRRDGEDVRHVEISGRPLFDDRGRVVGYRGTGRDITEQVNSREKLDKALRWLEQAIRAAGIGLWERDIETWTFSLRDNWRALFGYAEDEIGNATKDFDRLVHPDDLARIHAAGHAYAANPQREYETRFRIRHKDGSWRWVLSRGNVMSEPVTGRRTFVGCHLDVTGQMQAEQKITELAAMLETRVKARTTELEEANRELDAFNFSVSHDLRTPLRAIEGFSQALLEDCNERLDATGREYLARICRSTARMGELIDALYELSRMARAPLRLGPVDLSAMARELAAELREQDRLREVAFEIAATPLAEGDARLLRIVLANLLGNAWKFTAKTAPARIVLGAQRDEEGRVIYFLRDNGTGFDMRFADKLFRIFHRLHREEEFPGQGVGLTTVQRIIARHGGRVWGEAERGAGATFYFTLWTDSALLADAQGNMEDAETGFR